jgi:hypothetical protein
MPTNYNINSPRDDNSVPADLFEIVGHPGYVAPGQIDEFTGRVLVDAIGSIGPTGAQIAAHFITDIFVSTNGQTIFTASQAAPLSTEYITENGSIMTPSSEYSISGNTLTLSSGVPSNITILWRYIY